MTGGPHITAWVKAMGAGPWPCWKCGGLLQFLGGSTAPDTGIVHHEDENTANNDISNLRCMHHRCHVAYHNGKRIISAESRARMSAAQKRRRATEPAEVRDRFVRSWTGRTHSEETRQKISQANRGRRVADDARQKISESLRGNQNSKGRPMPAETRAKIAASLRQTLAQRKTPES